MDPPLESVVQAELDLPRRRTDAADLAKITIGDSTVGIAVAGKVENIEEVSPEGEHIAFAPKMEVLEQRGVDLAVAGPAFGTVVRGTESKWGRSAISTGAVRRTIDGVVRRWIGPPPVIDRTVADDQLVVLVGPTETKGIESIAVVRREDGDRKS